MTHMQRKMTGNSKSSLANPPSPVQFAAGTQRTSARSGPAVGVNLNVLECVADEWPLEGAVNLVPESVLLEELQHLGKIIFQRIHMVMILDEDFFNFLQFSGLRQLIHHQCFGSFYVHLDQIHWSLDIGRKADRFHLLAMHRAAGKTLALRAHRQRTWTIWV